MKKVLFLASLFFSIVTPGFAVLSPLYEGLREIEAIAKSEEMGKMLPQSESIQVIHRIDAGYLIFTNHYQVFVEVKYTKQEKPGPRPFNLIFFEPSKLSS